MTLTFFQDRGSLFQNENLPLFVCKHDNSTNISRIGPKLIPWMYLGVSWLSSKMDDLDFFQGRGSPFKNENLHFLLVSTITQQILGALFPN